MSGESYIQHHLNVSKTKEAHLFPKEQRFQNKRRLATEAIYHLPSTHNKRTTCFGFGNKISLANTTFSPPPTSYNLPSEFQKKDLRNVTSLGQGREKVAFGSFIWQALKRTKNLPSPDKYEVQAKRTRIGGNLGQRIKTDFDLKYHKDIPGPGTYQMKATEIGNGNYSLSTYKNNTSPRYFSDASVKETKLKANLSTLSYDIQEKQIGKYFSSKYKNSAVRTFSKAKRPGLENKNLLFTPGFKYRRFSEFNGFPDK